MAATQKTITRSTTLSMSSYVEQPYATPAEISQSPGEMRDFEERARYMIQIAAEALADIEAKDKPGFVRFIWPCWPLA